MEMTWQDGLEVIGWMALSVVKFIATPAAAVAAGVPPWQAFAMCAGGAALGFIAMRPASRWLFQALGRRRRKRGKPTFTRGRRRLLGIKRRFGLWGIAAVGGVLGVPVAALIAFKYFGTRPETLWVLIVVFSLWSAALTALAAGAFL